MIDASQILVAVDAEIIGSKQIDGTPIRARLRVVGGIRHVASLRKQGVILGGQKVDRNRVQQAGGNDVVGERRCRAGIADGESRGRVGRGRVPAVTRLQQFREIAGAHGFRGDGGRRRGRPAFAASFPVE